MMIGVKIRMKMSAKVKERMMMERRIKLILLEKVRPKRVEHLRKEI